MAINYDSIVRFVGDDHKKRTSRRRAPPIQSEVAGDYSQTLNLNLYLQSHTESCDYCIRLFGGRLRLIGGHRRSSEICLGCPQWMKNLASNRTILILKIRTATGVAIPKNCDKKQASGERLRRVQNREICLKILFELPGF